jgi:hypothetical protein
VSRSWTERARLSPAASAGLAIGRDYVGLAYIGAGKAGAEVRLSEEKLDSQIFSGAPTPQAADALTQALRKVAGSLTGRYLPIHVSLPDALLHWTVLELDHVPAKRSAQLELVAFRFARQGLSGKYVHACQPLGRSRDKHLLLGTAGDAGWHRLVSEALERAGIVAWTVNGNACRQFNLFHDRLTGASGSLVCLAPDAWSLWLWDSEGRTRYARGRWRSGAGDYDEIALDVERSILAYVHGDPARTVAGVFAAAGEESAALERALNARLREPCTRLSVGDLKQIPSGQNAVTALLSLAAALER